MELGEKLRQARLQAGLSQRQLCGDRITRNMLSQIENGSARPSMTTLQLLAQRLGKPIGYFLEEEDTSELSLLKKALTAPPEEALGYLQQYTGADPAWEPVHRQLLCRCYLALAEKAFQQDKRAYALSLLESLREADTTGDFRKPYALLLFRAAPEKASQLTSQLSSIDEELLLRAQAAFDRGMPARCLELLQAASFYSVAHQFLEGKALIALARYKEAAQSLAELEETPAVCALLEQCYKELKDFEKAYYYACLQR